MGLELASEHLHAGHVEHGELGGRSGLRPPAGTEELAKKIPGARLEVIKNAGHSSNLDQPDAFNRVFVEFLDSLPR